MAVPPALIKKAIKFKANRMLKKASKRNAPKPITPPQAPKQNLTPIYLLGGVLILALLLKK
jgi:hypothetical protein